jgi:hypothetical protein
METSIGSIWTQPERVHVHVPGMVPLFQHVWLIFKRASGALMRYYDMNSFIQGTIGRLTWIIPFAKP